MDGAVVVVGEIVVEVVALVELVVMAPVVVVTSASSPGLHPATNHIARMMARTALQCGRRRISEVYDRRVARIVAMISDLASAYS